MNGRVGVRGHSAWSPKQVAARAKVRRKSAPSKGKGEERGYKREREGYNSTGALRDE